MNYLKVAILVFAFILTHEILLAKNEKRGIDQFNEISLRVAANLYLEQGAEPGIDITADERTLDKLIIENIDQKLIIRFSFEDQWLRNFDPGKIEIHVTTIDINELNVQGSGNIIAENEIKTNKLGLNIAGSGDIKLSNLNCESIKANITGSGDMILAGSEVVNSLDINIAGSGDVMAQQLKAKAGYIRIAGSGDCDLSVSDFLDAKVVGSGDIIYTGKPMIRSSITGSGKIHHN